MTPTGSNQSLCMSTTVAESMSDDIVVDQQPQNHQQPDSISVTVVFSKVTRQVLCLEAGKDFVDLLLSFLTLPIGSIVKLLSDASLLKSQESISAAGSKDGAKGAPREASRGWGTAAPLSAMSSVYDSVVKMDDSLLRVDKSVLLDSRPPIPTCARLLPFAPLEEDMKEVNYFCCGVSCHFVSRKFGAKCPRHKRKMETLCKMVDSDVERQGDSRFGGGHFKAGLHSRVTAGFMKAGTHFVVTNNLDIYPSSAIKSLSSLKMIQSERISDLDNIDVQVGSEEVRILRPHRSFTCQFLSVRNALQAA